MNDKEKLLRARILSHKLFDDSRYEVDDSFKPVDVSNAESFYEIHTTAEMLGFLEAHKDVELDARIMGATRAGRKIQAMDRGRFVEACRKNSSATVLRESFDSFSMDAEYGSASTGDDFIPMLGGPFFKNLYFYQDYIRMHWQSFYAYNHDPIAKAIINMTTDFVMGRGFRVACDTKDLRGQLAMVAWQAFVQANDLEEQIDICCRELSIYGETMWWVLPDNETKITYDLPPGEKAPTGVIPRIRLLDPSNIVEVVTYPEDITRRLAYVWLNPTQYQIYTGMGETTRTQPTLKFIYRQIPAEQILHFTVNTVSNEKRGRSDLYPVLGYLKRLRDCVDYSLIGLLKQSGWSIDTAIDGSQSDIDAYADSQKSIGTISPAGSEFIHSNKIVRQFLSAQGSQSQSEAFSWALSMVAAGTQFPVSYFGTHLSGHGTRAGAIVATEPVAKKLEKRQLKMKRIIESLWNLCMKKAGLDDIECDVLFPEIITQDRSAKLKDLSLAQQMEWIQPKRAAEAAAKEFDFIDFDWEDEIDMIKTEQAAQQEPAPLTGEPQQDKSQSALTSDEQKGIKQNAVKF